MDGLAQGETTCEKIKRCRHAARPCITTFSLIPYLVPNKSGHKPLMGFALRRMVDYKKKEI